MSITLGPIFNSQNGKVREWSITISLFNSNNRPVSITSAVDEMVMKDGYYASYYTDSGYSGMKITKSAPTLIRIGKNLDIILIEFSLYLLFYFLC